MKIKKIMAVSAAFASVSAILGGAVYAVGNYTASDARHLRDALLGTAAFTESDDVNGDNTVDAFDMCAMRKYLSSTGEYVMSNYAAVEENVKLVGRTCRKQGITWLVQSGSAIEFTVTGKAAEITLAGDASINNNEDYRSRYAVFVDGELLEDAVMGVSEKNITLFEGDVPRTSKIKVIHLSEAVNGAVGVKNISVTSNSLTPIAPEPKKELSIEFIGDSITCAYGVEGASSSESFKTTTENFMKSYAYLTAQKLDADYSAVSYSGHGIVSGYTSSGEKNSDSIVPDCYELTGKLPAYAESWDFDAHSYDVVVINLGTNDYSYVKDDDGSRAAEFTDGYIKFLETVRQKNPDAYIICTMGTMGGESVYELIEQAVDKYSSGSGDSRIMSYKSALQNAADGYGSDWHPSEVTQQNSAYVLADKICQVLGIESDKVGLDAAADAEYKVNIDQAKGGNAASYVGYDKSFWINMVTGGSSPDAIEAVVSGIELRKGGEYRLEFDYTSTVDVSIPVLVRSNSDGAEYHSGSIDAVSEKQHYSAEFSINEDNMDSAVVFQLGGTDYYNVTFSNIKIVKIA